MIKRKLKSTLDNEEGSGLVLALMVLLVLSVLGASLGVVTIGSLQLSTASRDTNSAYYIAEAGANMAYEEFENIVWDSYNQNLDEDYPGLYFQSIDRGKETIDGIINDSNIYPDFDPQFGDKPAVTIVVEEPIENNGEVRGYIIKSTGEVAGKKRTVRKPVTVTWVAPPKKEDGPIFIYPNIPKDAVLVSSNQIKTTYNGKVSGGEVYLTEMDKIYKLEDKLEKSEIVSYKDKDRLILDENAFFDNDWTVPSIPAQKPVEIDWTEYDKYQKNLKEESYEDLKLSDLSNSSDTLKGNYRILESAISESYKFNIGDNNVVIYVDRINLDKKKLEVKGSGSLTFVVKNKVILNNGAEIKGNLNLMVGESVTLQNESGIEGNITTRGPVTLNHKTEVEGNITAGKHVVLGSTEVVVEGNVIAGEYVTLGDKAKVEGNITAGKHVVLGSTKVVVEGNIIAGEYVTLGDKAKVEGNITAGKHVVLGSTEVVVEGNIIAREYVTLKYKADVEGNIVAGESVVLHEEVVVKGIILAKGNVEVGYDAEVTGSVIGKDITIDGTVKYKKYDTDNSAPDEGDSPGELNKVSIEKLLRSEPALESDD